MSKQRDGFLIKAPCGRHYFMSIEKVRLDYAEFLRDADGIALKTAKVKAAAEDIDFWFYEQFDWNDVLHLAEKVKYATPSQVKRALDAMMIGGLRVQYSPGDCSTRVGKRRARAL